MIAELTKDFAVKGTNVYDLGCSTGTTMINLDKVLPEDIHFVGIDNSEEMLKKCEANLKKAGVEREVSYENQDLNHNIELRDPSVVIFCLTLQFLRPLNRRGHPYRKNIDRTFHLQPAFHRTLLSVQKT